MILMQQIQDFLDEYCLLLGFEGYDKSVLEFKVNDDYFQIKLNGNEMIINEFKRFPFIEDLISGRKFKRSIEGLNELEHTYEQLFNELKFYTEYDINDLDYFITK